MNNITFPYLPPYQMPIINFEEEIKKLKYEIQKLNEKIDKLENKNKKNYLQKEDGKYMM